MPRLKVEIHSATVDTHSGVSKASGKPYELNKQEAWLYELGSPYPVKIQISLADKTKPKQPGIYSFDPAETVKVGNFGSIEIDDRQIEQKLKLEGPLKV